MPVHQGSREQREMKTGELEELIERSRSGDQEAQGELIRAAQERVYYHCKKIIKNEEDVRDAVQDVLLSMLEKLDSLREPAAFWGWLNQMTVHMCLNRASKKQRERRHQEPAAGTILEGIENLDDQEIPDKALDNEETRRMVRELVDALPESQRLCILLYYYDSMTVGEIARMMETSEGTIKSRLHYARKSIREGVERYAAQGLKLYGMPVLPFLSYFLQKEAETLAAGGMITAGEILAAAGGSAAAAAMSGTGVTIAAGAAGILTKGAAAIAVLVLAGAVTGGALLLRPHRVPTPEPPPPATAAPAEGEVRSHLTEPEAAEIPVQAVEEAPQEMEPAPPLSPVPTVLLTPEPEEPSPLPPALTPAEVTTPLLTVLTPWVPEPEPEAEPKPREEEEEARPARPDDREDDSGRDDGEEEDNSTAAPPVPTPPEEITYYPNPDFGTFLGIRDGVYEFTLEIESNQRRQPFPFVNGSGEMPVHSFRAESSNEAVVKFDGIYILGWSTGTAEVRYYIQPSRYSTEEIEAVVYVTVENRKPVDPEPIITINPACGIYEGTKNNVHIFRTELEIEAEGPSPLVIPERYYVHTESGNEQVAVWEEGGGFRAAGAGSTDLRLYISETENGPYKLQAIVYVTVPERKPTEPTEVIEGTLKEGYGYSSMFQQIWPEQAAGTYTYASTNPEVAAVRTYGLFSLLSPGKAVLTATEETTGKQYRLTVEAEDRYFKEMKLEDLTVQERKTVYHAVSPYYEGTYDDFIRAEWTSSDPRIFTAEAFTSEDYYMTPNSKITGVSAGTAELTAAIHMRVSTCIGQQEMIAKASCQVTVEPLPEKRQTVTAKPGYNSSFAKEWQGIPSNLVYTTTDPETVAINDIGYFSVLKAGRAVLTGESDEGRWILEVESTPGFNWEYTLTQTEAELWEGEGKLIYFLTSETETGVKRTREEWESSDPEIVTAETREGLGCYITGVSPGTAEVTGTIHFEVNTAAGVREMEDKVTIPVTVKSSGAMESDREKTLTGFGKRSGGGYLSTFSQAWGSELPEELTYESSAPEIVYIGTNGTFVTRSAGTAVLTATDPAEPDTPYRLTLTVEEGADWSRKVTPIELFLSNGAWLHQLDNGSYDYPLEVTSAHWSSSAPEVAEAEDFRGGIHRLQPKSPGTAEITGELEFTDDIFGTVYRETVSYIVLVSE